MRAGSFEQRKISLHDPDLLNVAHNDQRGESITLFEMRVWVDVRPMVWVVGVWVDQSRCWINVN